MRSIPVIEEKAEMPEPREKVAEALLSVQALNVSYRGERESVQAVLDLGFELHAGETLGIVGESGSGKTQTALALMGLLPETAHVSGSEIGRAHV